MSETYTFEYIGAKFAVDVDEANADPTTTEGPNLRTISGTWQTWRLDVERSAEGRITGVRLLRSVGPDGGEHPAGNLSPAASGPNGYGMVMISSDGYLYTIPTGYGVVGHLFSSEWWAAQVAEWETHVGPRRQA